MTKRIQRRSRRPQRRVPDGDVVRNHGQLGMRACIVYHRTTSLKHIDVILCPIRAEIYALGRKHIAVKSGAFAPRVLLVTRQQRHRCAGGHIRGRHPETGMRLDRSAGR